MNKTKLKAMFAQKKIILLLTGMIAGVLLLSSCGVNQETVDAKDREVANLRTQLTTAQQDAEYWTQLTSVFMPVAANLPSMSDHAAFMTPGGLMLALHYDNMDISQAQNLNWIAIGVPGKFSKQDQERIEKLYGKGFTHFHDLMADTHGHSQPGGEGVWFIHIAVRDFDAPWGHLKPGVDAAFMPTPPPDVP